MFMGFKKKIQARGNCKNHIKILEKPQNTLKKMEKLKNLIFYQKYNKWSFIHSPGNLTYQKENV
jgi:hypothetical protein